MDDRTAVGYRSPVERETDDTRSSHLDDGTLEAPELGKGLGITRLLLRVPGHPCDKGPIESQYIT